MQTSIAASVAATVQRYPWVKGTAQATALLLTVKGTVWLGAAWLAMRGFNGL